MSKLARLLQSIEKFYNESLDSYLIAKYAAEPQTYVSPDDPEEDEAPNSSVIPTDTSGILRAADDLSYDIDNESLLSQFEGLVEAYKGFLNSLHVQANDFSKNPEQSGEDAGNLTSDYIDTINTRWQRLNVNPYLDLPVDSPKYTESFPPQRILDIAQAIVKDVDNKLKAEATQVGSTPEELISAQKAADEFTNQQQVDRRDPSFRMTGDVVRQQLAAQKRHREKLQLIKKIGPNHPEYEKVERHSAAVKRNYDAVMADPKRRLKVIEGWEKRKTAQRSKDDQINFIIAELNRSNDPNKQNRLKQQLVTMERIVLEREGKNLDDPFVLNDPKVQARLNPDNIIDRYQQRQAPKWRETEHKGYTELRESAKTSGDLQGLLFLLKKNMINVKMGIKKEITKDLASKKETTFKPYKDAIATAKNEYEKAVATKTLQKAINDEAEKEPALVAYKLGGIAYTDYIKILESFLISMNNPEVPKESLTAVIQNLITTGEPLSKIELAGKFKSQSTTIAHIIKKLQPLLGNAK